MVAYTNSFAFAFSPFRLLQGLQSYCSKMVGGSDYTAVWRCSLSGEGSLHMIIGEGLVLLIFNSR